MLVGPDGTEWLGNDFSQGFTTTGGQADEVNNVERIRVAPGALPSGAADYVVKVLHLRRYSAGFRLGHERRRHPYAATGLGRF